MNTRHPYAVRQTKSGYASTTKFLVVLNPGGRRVSVHAHNTRESAQAAADELNITALVKDHVDDPRPYADRRAEAESIYREEMDR